MQMLLMLIKERRDPFWQNKLLSVLFLESRLIS